MKTAKYEKIVYFVETYDAKSVITKDKTFISNEVIEEIISKQKNRCKYF